MDPNVDEVVDGEKGDKEIDRENTHHERDEGIVFRKYNRYVSQVKNLLNEEHIFLLNFMHEFSSTQAHDQDHSSTQVPSEADGTNKSTQTQKVTLNMSIFVILYFSIILKASGN